MRLIDADALLREIDGIHKRHYATSSYQFIHDFFLAMFRRIRNAPIIEAEPIKHAHWVVDGDWGECSHCREASKLSVMEHKDYCPACGSKMDEESVVVLP